VSGEDGRAGDALRLGTRASALALAQAGQVAALLEPAELVPMRAAGDRGAPPGDKTRWVIDLETALLEGEIDVAVHSAKDVPGELAPGLAITGVPVRADARDALCGAATLDDLPPGARVGTSSLRRQAQLRAARPDLDVRELRGNVDTRLRRLAEGDFDAIVLARAGLERLGRGAEAGGVLDPERFVPAPGQGCLALETRADAGGPATAAAGVTDPAARACLTAERALVRRLGASCDTPAGAHAVPARGGGLRVTAWVGLPDGSAWVRDAQVAEDPEALGAAVAERLLAAGAGERRAGRPGRAP
jgi:hydroxymethylbilane synthase